MMILGTKNELISSWGYHFMIICSSMGGTYDSSDFQIIVCHIDMPCMLGSLFSRWM